MPDFHWEDIITGLPLLWRGIMMTLSLSLSGFAAGLALGTILGITREELPGPLGKAAALYVELIRGIPLILFLVFVHYGLMPLVVDRPDFFISALTAFTLFEAAYVGEIIRGGLRSITQSERDAARSLGLTHRQRMQHMYLPLVFSRMAPTLVGQFISLVKDTSLASIVGVIELTRAGEIIYEQTYHDFEILVFQALAYFAVCFSLSRMAARLETGRNNPEKLALSAMQG